MNYFGGEEAGVRVILERDRKHGGDKKVMDKIGWKESEDLNAREVIVRIGKERTANIRNSRVLLY